MTLDAELLFKHTADGIAVLDEHLRIVRANDRAALMFRRPVPQLVGESILDLFGADGETEGLAKSKLTEAAASRVPLQFEAFLPGLFSWHAVLAVQHEGTLTLFLRDITDRVRREQDAAVQAIVRSIVEDLPIAVAITRGREHRFELANQTMRLLWPGRTLEGERVERALPESRQQGFIELLDSVYASGQRFEGRELPVASEEPGTGAPREAIFNVIYQPLFGASGEVNGVVHVGIDVTAQVRERELTERQATERAAVLDQLAEGVIITDASGTITYVNQAAKDLHGVAVLGVVPEGYTQTYNLLTEAGEPYPFDELPLARAVSRNECVTDSKWIIRRPDGSEVLVVGSAKPIMDAKGVRAACVLTMHAVHG